MDRTISNAAFLPPARGRCRSGAAGPGFTLIELLIAMVLLAIISVGLFTALRFSGRALGVGEERAAAHEETAAARRFLQARLGEARNVLLVTGPREQAPAFLGRPDGVRFVAPMPAEISYGGWYLFDLSFDPAHGDSRLRFALYRQRRLHELGRDPRVRERRLLPGLEPYFRYYGRSAVSVEAPDEWREDWRDRSWLPDLIRIDFRPTGKGGRGVPVPPPLIIRLREEFGR
ncbi:MAG: prepilin-type N-terminal cleavage/methylation domain-containing protein [Alphaproteobacteria bacterium]|nr:MAG: prepilin-type N-terminal cleavage/methylation domain-containing protein [Alphaproteobacteria bacterium]